MSNLRLYDSSDALVGWLEGATAWQPPLDRITTLKVDAPVMFAGANQLTLVESAYSLSYEGDRYIIQSYTTDEESTVSLDCESRAMEFEHYPATLCSLPATYRGKPSEIFTDALAGYARVRWPNGDCEKNDGTNPTGWTSSGGIGFYRGMGPVFLGTTTFGWYPDDDYRLTIPAGVRFKLNFWWNSNTSYGSVIVYTAVPTEMDGILVLGEEALPDTSGAWTQYTTGWLTAHGAPIYLYFYGSSTGIFKMKNLCALVETDDPVWSTASTTYDTVASDLVPVDDNRVSYDSSWDDTTSAWIISLAVGAKVAIAFSGPGFTLYWKSGDTGAGAYKFDGEGATALNTGTSDGSQNWTFDDGRDVHVFEFEVTSGEVRLGTVGGNIASVEPANVLTVEISGSLMDLLRAVQVQTGGEYDFNTEARTFTHGAVGANLRTTNVMFDLAPYLIEGSFARTHQQRDRYDKVLLSGAGNIRAVATAASAFTNPKWKTISDSSIKTQEQAQAVAQTWVDYYSGDFISYECSVTEIGAALISPGDTVRLPLSTPVEVRVLEMERSSESPEVRLALAIRRQDSYEGLAEEIARL